MFFINQPWSGREQRMGDHIIRLLSQTAPAFDIFRASVAYAKASGLLRLAPALQAFLRRGGQIEIAVGIDDGITSIEALELILKYSSKAYVFHNPVATFHPKLYLFERLNEQAIVFIGSSNLTAGGLFTNYEANVAIELNLKDSKDTASYSEASAIFINTTSLSTGNALELNRKLIRRLVQNRGVIDESETAKRRSFSRRGLGTAPSFFPRAPVLPAPRIDPLLSKAIPRMVSTRNVEIDQQMISDFHPWETFVMVLGRRDTQQKVGYSRDIYIPLAARDYAPKFWSWPKKFQAGARNTIGIYTERRISILARPTNSPSQSVMGVRLYYYEEKHEFRLNCGKLITGAKPGDLLIVQKLPTGTNLAGQKYEFEASILAHSHPDYQTFLRECTSEVPHSSKKWGYR